MPTNLYRIRTGSTGTVQGRSLLDTMEALSDAYARTRQLFAAMTAEQDDTSGTAAAFMTPAAVFGFCDATDALSAQVAHDAYAELNAMIAAAGPALEQACSRFRQ